MDAVDPEKGAAAPTWSQTGNVLKIACDAKAFAYRIRLKFPHGLRTLDGVPQLDVKVGGFWRSEFRKLSVQWLPHCIRQMEKGGRGEEMLNLVATAEINAGKKPSVKFKGCPWSDAYPFNTVESICLALEIDPGADAEWRKANDHLRAKLKEWIPIILAAQESSGYIHSFHALNRLEHFSNAAKHEFYTMGYFIEMGIAHFRMTKGRDRRLFDAAIRCADHLDSVFGPAPKRMWLNGCPGIEYAFCRLADAVNAADGPGEGDKYVRLARHFICNQHRAPGTNGRWEASYHQAERPAEEMKEATGHAVRACYFYTGMTAIANRFGDEPLAAASDRLFSNAIDRKWYITGGVGSAARGEAFEPDWRLPLDGYCEACASCAMSFWCVELHAGGRGVRTEDVRERLIYNLLLGSISNDGRNFLYRNPPNGRERHYPWHACPCCIGNIPRALYALKDTMYAFSRDGGTLYVDHFMDSESDVTLGGKTYHVKMATRYPDAGRIDLSISPAPDFKVVVRYPDRAESPLYKAVPEVEHGYREVAPMVCGGRGATALPQSAGRAGTPCPPCARYSWTLPMPYQEVTADERVEACRGRKAYQRGPTVYSWEGAFGDICVPFRDRLENGGFSVVWKGEDKLAGAFALHAWESVAEYKDIEIVGADGKVIWKGLPDLRKCRSRQGRWVVDGDVIRQTDPNPIQTELPFGTDEWRDCTVRFKARRMGGRHGFIFHVRHENPGRTVMVNIGGWLNKQHALEVRGYAAFKKEVVTCKGSLETGRWYDVEITCRCDKVGVKMDGKTLFEPVAIPPGDFL